MALRTSEMKRCGSIMVSCALCLLGAAMCSVPKGAVEPVAHGDAAASVPVPALSAEAARKAEKSLAIVSQGDPDASARALVALVPDGKTLLQYHDALLRVAENAQGEMNLDILREACPPYHRWHAESEITDPARSVAIFQWMGQKVWETPKGPDKEAAARAFIADVDRSIDAGRLKVGRGLRLAYHTIMMPDYVRPGVSAVPLVNLLEKHVTPDNRQLFFTLIEIEGLVNPDDVDPKKIHAFLQSRCPGMFGPDDTSWGVSAYVAQAIPMKWEEYEEIPTQSFESIRDKFSACQCGITVIPSRFRYCWAATERLVDEFDTKPEEVKAFLASLLAEKRLSPAILRGAVAPLSTPTDLEGRQPIAPDYVERKAGLFDLWLGYVEGRVQTKEPQGLVDAIRGAKGCLRFLTRVPLENRTQTIRQLEKRSVELLLTSGPVWKELRTTGAPTDDYGELPYGALADPRLKLSPETKQFLRERIQQLKADPRFLQGFPEEEQRALDRSLAVLSAPEA